MKITVKNFGVLKQAEFELGDLTIICGGNNSGKPYATHATFAFFEFLRSNAKIPVEPKFMDTLFSEGAVTISLEPYIQEKQSHLNDMAKEFSKNMFSVFASSENQFKNASLSINVGDVKPFGEIRVNVRLRSAEKEILQIDAIQDQKLLAVRFFIDKGIEKNTLPRQLVENILSDCIGTSILGNVIPKPFLASAERTGAAIFHRELDFTRNRLVELMANKSSKLDPLLLLSKFTGEYPLAVRQNVDFIRSLPDISNRESFILKEHPEILEAFSEIIGGIYKVSQDGEVRYIPESNKKTTLSLVESSSSVRSLLVIGFYLRHIAAPGDLLMIDEPELNLHPKNQRKIARLFAQLVNIGIKVFITTHSDYIIKELNTLIMLNQRCERLDSLAKTEGYAESEFLSSEKIRVYIAETAQPNLDDANKKIKHYTLVPADIDSKYGIGVETFDTTIDEMNRIQESIVWGGDE